MGLCFILLVQDTDILHHGVPEVVQLMRAVRPTYERRTSDKLEELELEVLRMKEEQRLDGSEEARSLLTEMFDKVVSRNGVSTGMETLTRIVKAMRADDFDTPRLACVLPPWEFKLSEGLSEDEQSRDGWTGRLSKWQENDFKEGKGFFKKKARLFLVCAHTYRLVPCGTKGQGYEICSFRKWVTVAIEVVTVVLEIACATLGTMVAARIPSTVLGNIAGVGAEIVEEGIAPEFYSRCRRFLESSEAGPVEQRGEVTSNTTVSTVDSLEDLMSAPLNVCQLGVTIPVAGTVWE